MRLRAIFAFLGIILASFYIFINNFYLSVVYFFIFSFLLSWEFSKIFHIKKVDYFFILGTIFLFVISTGLIFFFQLSTTFLNEISILILFTNFFAFSIFLIIRNETPGANHRVVKQLFVNCYVIFFFFHFLRLKHFYWFQDDKIEVNELEKLVLLYYTFFPFYYSWIVDASAFFSGNLIKGKKLGLAVSPNKTWAGLTTSLFFGAGGIVIYRYGIESFSPEVLSLTFFSKSIGFLIVISLFLTFICLFGDLTASLHKRSANIKDSGKFLKGHGGYYDRMDSTIILNFVFYYLIIFL